MEVVMEVVETYLKHKETTSIELDTIGSPQAAAKIFNQFFGDNSQECFGVICLNTKGKPTHFSAIYKGTMNQIVISPKDILKVAILSNAESIIIGHNHPSSDVTPSKHDIQTTRNIVMACKAVDVRVLDHIIINMMGEHYSIRKHHEEEFSVN
jgi:DNA repair protein RadC